MDLSDPARAALLSATVDGRLLGLLALAAGTHDLAVQALPQPAAERAAGAALRRVQISAVDGSPVTAAAPQVRDLLALMAAQDAQYRPVATLTGAGRDGTLTLTVPFAAS